MAPAGGLPGCGEAVCEGRHLDMNAIVKVPAVLLENCDLGDLFFQHKFIKERLKTKNVLEWLYYTSVQSRVCGRT